MTQSPPGAMDAAACLARLRDADVLLDSAPRTADAEIQAAASDRSAMGSGVTGALLSAAAGGGFGVRTPSADRELDEAIGQISAAARALADHPAAGRLLAATAMREGQSAPAAARSLSAVVREVHADLREELGLGEVPPLCNWTEDDAEDVAALRAAGLAWWSSPALKLSVGVVLATCGFVAFVAS